MKLNKIRLNKKSIIIGITCLFLWPIAPLILGIVFANYFYKRQRNHVKGVILATFVVLASFIPTAFTVSAIPSNPKIESNNLPPSNNQDTNTESNLEPQPTSIDSEKHIETAIVVRVIDGDTINFSINGKIEIVRVIGINTPETVDPRKSVECFGLEASKQAKVLLAVGSEVELESDPTQGERDKYNRLLRYVWINKGSVDYGNSMIAQGYAYEYTYDMPCKYQLMYRESQKQAEVAKKGLWADNACLVNTESSNNSPTTNVYSGNYSCTGPDLDCSDFSSHAEAQTFFDNCGFTATNDPMNLDGVKVDDGIACEAI